MHLITAIIRPYKLDEVKDTLKDLDVKGITVTEVKGFGRQGGHTETYRGAEYKVDLVPKIKLEILSNSDQTQSIVDSIIQTAQTGKIGDGKIWIMPLDRVYRIRTEEMNSEAI